MEYKHTMSIEQEEFFHLMRPSPLDHCTNYIQRKDIVPERYGFRNVFRIRMFISTSSISWMP
jgi:hypothetical protein